jgi:hypothetical protein
MSSTLTIELKHPTRGVISLDHVTQDPLGPNSEAAECDLLRRELGLEDDYQLYLVDGVLYCCQDGDVPADIGSLQVEPVTLDGLASPEQMNRLAREEADHKHRVRNES